MKETKWTIDGEYIVGPDNSPRFRAMGTAPYNRAWLRLASKAPEMFEALKVCCDELERIKNSQDNFTEEQLTDHALVDMNSHDNAATILNSIQNGGEK